MLRPLLPLTFSVLTACQQNVPEIGRDLPTKNAERTFDQRVKSHFPPGTDETRLAAELRNQGFRQGMPYEGVQDASYIQRHFPFFQTIWSVRWRARNGKVTEIWGVYGSRGP